jgi:hypothetical protein
MLLIYECRPSNGFTQNRHVINRHHFWDESKDKPNIWHRSLMAEVDSTGFTMSAWGGQCFMRVNVLDRMGIGRSYHRQGMSRNNTPYTTVGDNKRRVKMYNSGHGFEFDIQLLELPPDGQNTFSFDIETEGLIFYYRDAPTEQELLDGANPAEDLIGSYAVYHERHDEVRGNWTVQGETDTVQYNYGVAKFGQIRRPKAWDAAGDTVFGFLGIDTAADTGWVGVDSAWLYNPSRVLPIDIDPDFGADSVGVDGDNSMGNLVFGLKMVSGSDAAGATMDSCSFYISFRDNGGCNGVSNCGFVCGLYDHDAGNDEPNDSVTTQDTGVDTPNGNGWTASTAAWGAGTLSASTTYWMVLMSDHDTEAEIKIAYDDPNDAVERRKRSNTLTGADYPNLPANFGTSLDLGSDEFILSVFGSYTVAAAGGEWGRVFQIF